MSRPLRPRYAQSCRSSAHDTLALQLGGSRQGQVSRRRLLAFADGIGVRERAATMALDELLDASAPWLVRLDELPFDERRLHDLGRLMETRMRLLRGE